MISNELGRGWTRDLMNFEKDLSNFALEKVCKYLHICHYGRKTAVTFNEKAIAAGKRYHGYFALILNCEKNTFECLRKYWLRETVNLFFWSWKKETDGSRTRGGQRVPDGMDVRQWVVASIEIILLSRD